jgi:hypothetical protein
LRRRRRLRLLRAPQHAPQRRQRTLSRLARRTSAEPPRHAPPRRKPRPPSTPPLQPQPQQPQQPQQSPQKPQPRLAPWPHLTRLRRRLSLQPRAALRWSFPASTLPALTFRACGRCVTRKRR